MGALDNEGLEKVWLKMKEYVNSKTGSNLTLEKIYPIGSVYISVNGTNPSSLFGGTWVAWGAGRVPVGVNAGDGDFGQVEKTGGGKSINLSHNHNVNAHSHNMEHIHTVNAHNHATANHTLTIAEMPKHQHQYGTSAANSLAAAGSSHGTAFQNNGYLTGLAGGGQPHNHGNTGNSSPNTGAAKMVDGSTKMYTGSESPGTNYKLSASQSIIQPYITCYMWKRTA